MKDYKKYFPIAATPDQVYLALTTETTIMLWTGDHAEMKPEPETEFSMWNGAIVGRNLEFEKDKKIVQQWYFGIDNETSIVTIKLHPDGDKATSAELRHTNIPDDDYEDIVQGWNEVYFGSLQDFYK